MRRLLRPPPYLLFVASAAVGCVPDDPPKGSRPAASATPRPLRPDAWPRRPATVPPTTLAAASGTPPTLDPPLTAPFTDHFDGPALDPSWLPTGASHWRIENGRLCVAHARNHPIWLRKRLPVNARIEFDATSYSEDGDLKAEFWGDGRSAAEQLSYTDATSYLTIFGGWKNSFHVLARINEHEKGRPEIPIDDSNDDPRARRVLPNRDYHFKVSREDGRTVKWSVDGVELFAYTDPEPLAGTGHDHFGFNDWDVRACFDNLTVTPLP